ncbi:copper transporter [Moniliophthora roreri MCA 2997]|uniref:Copper transport protein n=2 Tax=Moniliophthora roreri TaxID=221103 RepID=V2W7Z5_MONRO|nr:copper transporter [Moniliophthora roreri MCA 2997]
MSFRWNIFIALLCFLLPVLGHGQEPSADTEVDSAMHSESESAGSGMQMMMSYFHVTLGDTLWFEGWVPKTNGALAGAAIGLFLLAILDRGVAGARGIMEAHWKMRAQLEHANKFADLKGAGSDSEAALTMKMRTLPPFNLARDIARGVMQAAQATLGFALMLAVMTFQVAFILSIIIGLGVGETLFGRFNASAHVH